jgi:hypothetical protein
MALHQGIPGRATDTMNDAAILGLRAVVDHGTAFDRAFLKSVRDDHVGEIAKVNAWYGPAAKRDSVKAYLRTIMPTLAKHRDTAEKLLASK